MELSKTVVCRVSGSTINGKDIDGDGVPDIPLRYEMEESDVVVQFPIGFCPNSEDGVKLNCSGNFGIVLKEWETITRVGSALLNIDFYLFIYQLFFLDLP